MARAPLLALFGVFLGCTSSIDVLGEREQNDETPDVSGPLDAPDLPNVLDLPTSVVDAQVNDAFSQLFFGDPETEAVFRDQGDGTGFIEDIANNDVRTDSMGYGMLVTVQLDQREVFDKLWAWARTHMLSQTGPTSGLLSWRCETTGDGCAAYTATDASSVIVTSLLMAETRWSSLGRHDYGGDALALLDAMADIEERNGGVVDGVVNCFNTDRALPRSGSSSPETQVPVDYLMPAFYEMWSKHDTQREQFWLATAENSRALLSSVSHDSTGLLPEKVTYDGAPIPESDDYTSTTSRTLLNLSLDNTWYGPRGWIVEDNERRLDFFLGQGIDSYVSQYTLEGEPLVDFNTVAHSSLVALAAGTSDSDEYEVFMDALLAEPVPEGTFRYYDGMLYMLSLLVLSGQLSPG